MKQSSVMSQKHRKIIKYTYTGKMGDAFSVHRFLDVSFLIKVVACACSRNVTAKRLEMPSFELRSRYNA